MSSVDIATDSAEGGGGGAAYWERRFIWPGAKELAVVRICVETFNFFLSFQENHAFCCLMLLCDSRSI